MKENGSMLISTFKYCAGVPLVCFGIACLLIGCQSNPRDGTHKPSYGNSRIDTLNFRDTSIREFSPYFTENDGEIDTTFVAVTYPKFEDTVMNQIVKDNILLEGEQNIEQFMGNFLESYGNFMEENDVSYPLAWSKTTEIDVGLHTPQLIVLKNRTYEFSGGAHGNSFQLWNVYDIESYRKLPFNTFIPDDKIKDFTKIAEKFFREHEGLADSVSLDKFYFFEEGVFTLAANYGVSESGIVFHYNPYEIKPYVAGSTTVTIPFEAVQDYLSETGKNYFRNIRKYINSTS